MRTIHPIWILYRASAAIWILGFGQIQADDVAAVVLSTLCLGLIRLAAPRPLSGVTALSVFYVVVLFLLLRSLWTERTDHPEPEVGS